MRRSHLWLAVVGLVHPDKIKRNDDAKDGDVLVWGKGLGVGILGAAMNKDECRLRAMKRWWRAQPNSIHRC